MARRPTLGTNPLGLVNRTKTTPIAAQRTTRIKRERVLTSLPAGKMVPLFAVPLLREDSITRAEYRIAFEMNETVEVLMNAVNVRVMAYLVPRLAFERYDGLDSLNKSWAGLPLIEGEAVTPWVQTLAAKAPGEDKIMYYMGKHARTGQLISTDYHESYNAIWNHRAKNRSKDLTLRTALDDTLAPAFWTHQTWAHVVPTFDQAIIDGEVPLNISSEVSVLAPVKGLAVAPPGSPTYSGALTGAIENGGTRNYGDRTSSVVMEMTVKPPLSPNASPNVHVDLAAAFAELAEAGITVSLSNIELARKTQAFASLRRQYAGHDDAYIIDLLMNAISIPDEQFKQPILLADQTTVVGMSKRYASDGASLTESVVNGLTAVDIRFRVPRVGVGGVVMVVAEISPEQLFERQMDPYLHATTVDEFPQFLRDTLDPEKVVIVKNEEIDIDHDTPDGTFGYAPLNHQWSKSQPNIGGKFLRPAVDEAFDEDRQRIWAVETQNPTLSTDFYLVSNLHLKPFVVTDTAIDPFECLARGEASIQGLTVFGGLLIEAEGDYEAVLAEAPQDRIELPADTTAGTAASDDVI